MASNKCGGCGEPVSGQVIQALNKKWHLDHFVCGGCRQSLGSKSFFERDGIPFCEPCHAEKFASKCGKCKKPIVGKSIIALDQSWHPEHFVCVSCDKKFDEKSGFQERDGQPICMKCFQGSQDVSVCFSCKKDITDSYLTAMDQQWHPNCFVCQECHKPFGNGSYYETDGLPYCEHDYHMRLGLICVVCKQIVKGRCVTALGNKYHPEHFVCSVCKKQLTKSSFYESNGEIVCDACTSVSG